MIYRLKIKRQKGNREESYWQTVEYVCGDDGNETVATALISIENGKVDRDIDGNVLEPIAWECSCLQRKCGSCAMVIDGKPGLACGFFLKQHKGKKPVVIEPLRKFPVVKDLIVDRSIMRENLKKIQAWMAQEATAVGEKEGEIMYDASRCLQCGCCLEVCPNFCAGESFCGAAGAIPVSRMIQATDKKNQKDIKKNYHQHFYKECGKSLACQEICPAKIKMERVLSRTNALAIWR